MSVHIALRPWTSRVVGFRLQVVAVGILVIAAAAVVAATLLPARGPAKAAAYVVPISQSRASQLIEFTTGEAVAEMQATGDRAKLINASLPFAQGPVLPAPPFAVSGSSVEKQRALLCLTQAVYYEAGYEPIAGRRAVAQVVLNRMRHPAFPKSVCGVVYQSNGPVCQFTFACDGSLKRVPAAFAWREAAAVAQAALAGYVESSVGSATHYHADYVAPRWAPLLAKVAQLGQHVFYRWPGSWGLPAAFTGRYIGEPSDPSALHTTTILAEVAGTEEAATAAVVAGPPVVRAASDVGGLLDTSKGWTLNISLPEEGTSAADRAIAAQQAAAATHGPNLTAATPAAAAN